MFRLSDSYESIRARDPITKNKIFKLPLPLGCALEFEASVWMRDPWNHRIAGSKLRESIWAALKQHQISIAFPQLDLHIDSPVAESLRVLSNRKTTAA